MVTNLLSRFACFLCLVFSFGSVALAGGDDPIVWRPVSPEEIQMKAPKVEADADAEAIFWEVRLDDKKETKVSYDHYVRVKIFTERGRERFSKFDIPFAKGKVVEGVAARVIKPDGTIVNLNPSDIYEREIVRAGKVKVMAKSFAVPGIEPGVIVEYQYKEVFKDSSANGVRLIFQRDIPVQKILYYVRPQKGYRMNFNYYNVADTTLFAQDHQNKDFFLATMENVPAYKEEPYMPPEDEVRRWVYANYQSMYSNSFSTISMAFEMLLRNEVTNPSKAIKQKAAELVAGAPDETTKLRKLYEFVQKQIKNTSFDRSISSEAREKLDIDKVDDVLKKGAGNAMWVDLLFASLAYSSGFPVAVVLSGDRSENFFDPQKYPFVSFIHPGSVAVKVGTNWRLFNPGAPFLPFGRLVWYEEGTKAMLVSGGYNWITVPAPEPAASLYRRSGKFTLKEDGALEGTLTLEYTGQPAFTRRREGFNDNLDKRLESLKDDLKGRISTAEIASTSIDNFDDNTKPLSYTATIKIPNYATKTGKRLFLQPGFFEYGNKPVFSSATRINSISFPYGWSETDNIQIQLPAGFELDSADSPAEVTDQSKIANLKVAMSYDKATNSLVYRRTFFFGAGGNLLFPATTYPALKSLFDDFYRANSHVITLKQKQ